QFGPVKVTEVCHLWRAIILDIPSAWSWIYMHTIKEKRNMARYLSTFIERSQQCMLHIHIPVLYMPNRGCEMLQQVLSSLIPASHRIQCLSTPIWLFQSLDADVTFPNLLCLRFNEEANRLLDVYEFSNKNKFPRLQILLTSYCCWTQSPWDDQKVALPPLKHLTIEASKCSTWVEVITACAETLVTLNIRGPLVDCGIPRICIKFPMLQRLKVDNTFAEDEDELFWPLEASTPSLISYEELTKRYKALEPIHRDVKTVTHLRTDNLELLPAFPALRTVQLVSMSVDYTERCALDFVEKLEEGIPYCPMLERFLFCIGDWAEISKPALIQRDLNARIERAGRAIEFKFVGPMDLPSLPGQTLVCGTDSQCRYDQEPYLVYM
ncbi:hypothetical protein M408DRAFT_330497, partial [Serendipita vermifera MAFF 305830]